ncbi:MAG: hypothetical protein A2V83_08760 [Nitrospirae bacterium RBG_16_64_22]|nr:MAG: hypothetical protein A2V83_08760 [Nitrospirae bacterium RBG_16_64_22]
MHPSRQFTPQNSLPVEGPAAHAAPALNERGATLIIALLLLLVVSLIGIAGITIGTTELQIAGNQYRGTQLLYAADAGIEAARSQAVALAQAQANPYTPFDPGITGNLAAASGYNVLYTVNPINQVNSPPVQCPAKYTGITDVKENWCIDFRIRSTGSSANFPGANMVVETDVGARWTPPQSS